MHILSGQASVMRVITLVACGHSSQGTTNKSCGFVVRTAYYSNIANRRRITLPIGRC